MFSLYHTLHAKSDRVLDVFVLAHININWLYNKVPAIVWTVKCKQALIL